MSDTCPSYDPAKYLTVYDYDCDTVNALPLTKYLIVQDDDCEGLNALAASGEYLVVEIDTPITVYSPCCGCPCLGANTADTFYVTITGCDAIAGSYVLPWSDTGVGTVDDCASNRPGSWECVSDTACGVGTRIDLVCSEDYGWSVTVTSNAPVEMGSGPAYGGPPKAPPWCVDPFYLKVTAGPQPEDSCCPGATLTFVITKSASTTEGDCVTGDPAGNPLGLPAGGPGPGTELKAILSLLGVNPDASCSCNTHAFQMNLWGVEGCRENRATIIGWLRDGQQKWGWRDKFAAAARAVKSGLAFKLNPLDPFPGLVDESIRRAAEKVTSPQPHTSP